MKNVQKLELLLLFIIAVSFIATLGSLALSEILIYEPCKLCWIQRIFMYPIFIISLVAFLKREYHQYLYIYILSLLGMSFSLYHLIIQKTPYLQTSNFCRDTDCYTEIMNIGGFITIPFLASVAFFLIMTSSLYIRRSLKEIV